jgi:hypothetical protein
MVEGLHVNGGGLFWSSEALTNWSNQLTLVCCVCVWLRQPVSACLLAFNGWGKSWSVVLGQPPTQSTYPFPHCPQHTHTRHTNTWTNDKTLKNFFSCITTCEATIHGLIWNSPVSFFFFFLDFLLLTKIWPSDKLVSVVHTPHSSKSISSSAQYVTLRKYISDWSFSYILFCNPTHQTETQIANRWGTTR